MALSAIIKGLGILLPHYTNPEYQLSACDDQLMMYPTNTPLSREEVEELITLGWWQDLIDRVPYQKFEAGDYSQTGSWYVDV